MGEVQKVQKIALNIIILSLLLSGCSIDLNSGRAPGSVTTSFITPSSLQLSPLSQQGQARRLIIGALNEDRFPDILELTQKGVILFLNQSAGGWFQSTISETLNADYTAGFLFQKSSSPSDLWGLMLYKPSSGLESYFSNGAGQFLKQSELSRTDILSDLAYSPLSATRGRYMGVASQGQHFIGLQESGLLNLESPTQVAASFTPEEGIQVKQGDINGDGIDDFILVPRTTGNFVTFLVSSNGSVSQGVTISRSSSAIVKDFHIVELDQDRTLDILLLTEEGVEFYRGQSAGAFIPATISFDTDVSAHQAIVAADFTGDNQVDIFMTGATSGGQIYSQTSNLAFTDITTTGFTSRQLVSGAIRVYVTDLNGDSEMDIIELFDSGKIAVHINSR